MQDGRTRPRTARLVLLAAVVLLTGAFNVQNSDAGARLAPLPPAVPGQGGYSFLVTDDAGRPATFDPCRPVHWVLRQEGSPEGGEQVVHTAVREIARSTGLHFLFGGVTDEAPGSGRPQRQPERYGTRTAPVLVAWSTDAETPALAGPRVGFGIASWAENRSRLVSGQVVLDADELTARDGGPTPLAAVVVLHELAHVVGLGHVEDADQLLHVTLVPGRSLGDGDLRGLRAAGSGPCS